MRTNLQRQRVDQRLAGNGGAEGREGGVAKGHKDWLQGGHRYDHVSGDISGCLSTLKHQIVDVKCV